MSDVISPNGAQITVTPMGGEPAAPAPTPAAPAPGTGNPATVVTDWTASLPDDVKGYVQNKGFKDPAQVVDAYRNFEKLKGVPQERLLTLPDKEDSPDWNSVYTKLGKPASASEYKIAAPEGQDGKFAEWAKGVFHGANLSNKQAEMIAAKWNEHLAQTKNEQALAYKNQADQEENALKKEWGAAHGQNIELAKKAAQTFGIDPDTMDKMESVLGYGKFMKMMQNIGSKLGEDSFVSPSSGNNGGKFNVMTPQAAHDKIKTLMADKEWAKKYVSGDASARQEFEHLHRMANPDA